MPNIQYYVNNEGYRELIQRGEKLGISEHRLAKYILTLADVSDEEIKEEMRRVVRERAQKKRQRLGVRGVV